MNSSLENEQTQILLYIKNSQKAPILCQLYLQLPLQKGAKSVKCNNLHNFANLLSKVYLKGKRFCEVSEEEERIVDVKGKKKISLKI